MKQFYYMNNFEVGNLVLYYNQDRIPHPFLGIILYEHQGIAVENRFFQVLLNNGTEKIISDSYLRRLDEVE